MEDFSRLNFPKTIIRGQNVLDDIGSFCKTLGNKVFIFGGKKALEQTQEKIIESLNKAGISVKDVAWYGGESSRTNIDELKEKAKTLGADVLIAVGGGKALDTGKLVAYESALPLITVPTIAATCAAVTPVSVEYSDNGEFVAMVCFDYCPEGVFIDTNVILKAPIKYLAAGLGDTLAKWYEYRVSIVTAGENSITLSALAQGKLCYDLIKTYGEDAANAVKTGVFHPALDCAVDSIITCAGLASIFGGVALRSAAAHGFYNTLTLLPGGHELSHGLTVGYGNLFLLALEERSDEEILDAMEITNKCAVPITLKDIGAFSEEDMKKVSIDILETPDMQNMPFQATSESVLNAVNRVEELAKRFN